MFEWISRSRRKAPPVKQNSFRPMLEQLEDRYCPSTISLNVMEISNSTKVVGLMGQVTNTPSPSDLTVQLGGEMSGTTTTNSNGYFWVNQPAAGLGTVTATTTDGQSNVAQVTLTDPSPPQITQFSYMEYSNGMYVFEGQVSRGYQGEVVNLSGLTDLQGKTATVDSNGNFSIVVHLDGQMDDNGDALAITSDVWGTNSNQAASWVMQT